MVQFPRLDSPSTNVVGLFFATMSVLIKRFFSKGLDTTYCGDYDEEKTITSLQ